MNPYRSVNGASVLLNREAVRSVGTALEDWKNDPNCCLDSSTVGGRFSSATIDDSSTEGRGIVSVSPWERSGVL
jgi:hypothetical protein